MQPLTDSTIRLLQEQNQLLRALIAAQNKPALGFSDRPPGQPQWIFIGRHGDSCWYSLDKDSKPVPIAHRALTGWITGLAFEKVTRRGKESHKLNATIRTDTTVYTLSTGHDTCFAKSLMASLAIITDVQLRQPITLSVSPGDDESIVWCRLYAPDYVKAPQWDDSTDWRAIAQAALIVVQRGQNNAS
ncbi:MAG: hypothetical protein C6Y22_29945 [Hapalosiphonaceae cyanobacterium JJU2]|nr:MAG: hypothetical protein C6Y22_29945 [Hapalosiphonaceae cyanobacterium JJU2]